MTKKQTTYLLYAFGLSVFIFLIFRCLLVPPFPDEILNFHVYVDTNDFIPFKAYPDANNHLISTFFNWISFHLFGSNVIWMRLFELGSFVLFFYSLMRIRSFFQSNLVAACFVITLSSGFFILTFFSLARGYGMSIAFFITAIFYLLSSYQHQKLKHITYSFLFCGLTLWSNLSMTISILLIVLLLCYRFFQVFKTTKPSISFFILNFFVGFAPILLAIIYGFHLKAQGAFWLGGNVGFYHDVYSNLSYRFLGDKGIWIVSGFLALAIITLVFHLKKIQLNQTHYLFVILFLGTLIGTICLHLLLGVNYPHNRAALHILILFLCCLLLIFDLVKTWFNYLALIPAGLVFGLHLTQINFSYPSGWKDSTMNKNLYDALISKQKNSNDLLTISAPFYFGEVVHYFNYRNPSRLNNIQWTGYPNKIADFIIANPKHEIPELENYDTVYFNNTTRVSLLEKKQRTEWSVLDHKKLRTIETNDTLISLGSFYLYLNEPQPILTKIATELSCSEKVDLAAIYVLFLNNNNEEVYSEEIILNQYRSDFTMSQKFEKSLFFNIAPEEYVTQIVLKNPRGYNWKIKKPETWLFQGNLN